MGCVLIDMQSKRAHAIKGDGSITHNISLRSGMHFVRNYHSKTVGIVVYNGHNGRHEVAYMECSRNGTYFAAGARKLLRKLNDRLLKVLICSFEYVAFCSTEHDEETQ